MLVVMVAVQAAAGSIFLFEWFSPSGYNMTDSHHQVRIQIINCFLIVKENYFFTVFVVCTMHIRLNGVLPSNIGVEEPVICQQQQQH